MWNKVQSIGERPEAVDYESSKKYVYIRKDFAETVNDDGNSVWNYDEAKVLYDDAKASDIISENRSERLSAIADYNIMMGKLLDPEE